MKFRRFAAAVCAAVMVFSCGAVPAGAVTEEMSLSECTSQSDCIVLASYAGRVGKEYRFRCIRVLKGGMSGAHFYVTASADYADMLEKGKKYVLYLDREISVYYTHDKYNIVGDIFIAADPRNNILEFSVDGEPREDAPATVADLALYIDEQEDTSVPDRDYIRNSTVDRIVSESPVIVKAVVEERLGDFCSGCGVYSCRLTENVRGEIPDTFDAVLFDLTVSEGEEFYLLLETEPENGSYILTSKNSIFSTANAEFTEILNENL